MPLRLTAMLVAVAIAAVGLVSGPAVSVVSAAGPRIASSGSPFSPDGDGVRDTVSIELSLPQGARVDLVVNDFDGRRVKTLLTRRWLDAGSHSWTWKGFDERGRRVPAGPYRVRATVRDGAGGELRRSTWITQASRVPYPVRPDVIVVALDPGHGGPAAGAVWRGLAEDAVNLDIGLRLEAMLRGAGVGVVMTRRSDRNVSPVGLDLSGDQRYSRLDELIARNDVANQARADIHLALHNNASSCHCTRGTEMFTHDRRSWSPEGRKLARLLLDEHLRLLGRVKGYEPVSRGVKFHDFKALKPYHPRLMPRPSLQPSVLGESLFMDRPSEHRILDSGWGRARIAAAYFDGIARYLAWRPYGLHYDVLERRKRVAPGGTTSLALRLTNTGRLSSSGWKVTLRVVPSVRRYDGRPRRGDVVRKVPVPDGLGPGESVDVTVPGIPMPGRAGQWLVKVDVALPGGDTMAAHGVVGPQLRVRTVEP